MFCFSRHPQMTTWVISRFDYVKWCCCQCCCTNVHVSVFSFLGDVPRSGIAGYGNSMFNFFLCFPLCLHHFTSVAQVPIWLWFANIFFKFCELPFHKISTVLWCTKVLNFGEIQFTYFFFGCLFFWYHIKKIITKPSIMRLFTCVFI